MMRLLIENPLRMTVAPPAWEQWYNGTGISYHIVVENVSKGAMIVFKDNVTGDILWQKRMAAASIVLYLPKLVMAHEHELQVTDGPYGAVHKVFDPQSMSVITRVKLTEMPHNCSRKIGIFQRLKNAIGW